MDPFVWSASIPCPELLLSKPAHGPITHNRRIELRASSTLDVRNRCSARMTPILRRTFASGFATPAIDVAVL